MRHRVEDVDRCFGRIEALGRAVDADWAAFPAVEISGTTPRC